MNTKKATLVNIILAAAAVLVTVIGIELYIKSRTLVVVTADDCEPFSFRDDSGRLCGIDIDIARELANRLDKKLEIICVDRSEIFEYLESGNADIAIAALSADECKAGNAIASKNYCTVTDVFVAGSEFFSNPNASLKRILVKSDTATERDLSAIGGYEVIALGDYNDIFDIISRGTADAVAAPIDTALKFTDENENLIILADPFYATEHTIAISKTRFLSVQEINLAVSDIEDEEIAERLVEKYIGSSGIH